MVKKFLFDTWYGALVALASVSAVLLGAIVADGYLGEPPTSGLDGLMIQKRSFSTKTSSRSMKATGASRMPRGLRSGSVQIPVGRSAS